MGETVWELFAATTRREYGSDLLRSQVGHVNDAQVNSLPHNKELP